VSPGKTAMDFEISGEISMILCDMAKLYLDQIDSENEYLITENVYHVISFIKLA
jgi:hypothetical protein